MTSISRTAYPRLYANQRITQRELDSYYVLTQDELDYVKQNARGDDLRLCLAVQLKIFQQLNYFPDPLSIPRIITDHIKKQLTFISDKATFHYQHDSAIRRHYEAIYAYLNVAPWKKQKSEDALTIQNPVEHYAIQEAYTAAQTMNNPADIINVVIEALRNKHYELPTFNQLERLVKHTRNLVNRKIFLKIEQQLSPKEKEGLETLLIIRPDYNRTGFNGLKQLPKNPTINHFKELIKHHEWLMSFGNVKKYVENVPLIKLQQFAEQAKSLDASDLKDLSSTKRYALMVCLIYRANVKQKMH
jgi:hypothetical protein